MARSAGFWLQPLRMRGLLPTRPWAHRGPALASLPGGARPCAWAPVPVCQGDRCSGPGPPGPAARSRAVVCPPLSGLVATPPPVLAPLRTPMLDVPVNQRRELTRRALRNGTPVPLCLDRSAAHGSPGALQQGGSWRRPAFSRRGSQARECSPSPRGRSCGPASPTSDPEGLLTRLICSL